MSEETGQGVNLAALRTAAEAARAHVVLALLDVVDAARGFIRAWESDDWTTADDNWPRVLAEALAALGLPEETP